VKPEYLSHFPRYCEENSNFTLQIYIRDTSTEHAFYLEELQTKHVKQHLPNHELEAENILELSIIL
jgi:hypothetical protein